MGKNINTRITQKHDIEANWQLASGFIPKQGELIIYDDRYIDDNDEVQIVATAVRYKIGDGVRFVNDLPFADQHLVDDYHKKIYGYCGDDLLIIPEGTTKIGPQEYSDNYKCIVIPGSVTEISADAFSGHTNLVSVVVKYGVTSLGHWMFSGCTNLASVEIPNTVTSIESYAFENCKKLVAIIIPNSVISIGDRAFSGCSSLTSVVIPDSVTSIGSCAFQSCTSLTSVVIGEGVMSIGGGAFGDCNFSSIVIPGSVTNIGNWPFEGDALRIIEFKNAVNPPQGDSTIFQECFGLSQILVPVEALNIYKNAYPEYAHIIDAYETVSHAYETYAKFNLLSDDPTNKIMKWDTDKGALVESNIIAKDNGSIIFNEGNASGNCAIAGGTTDKSALTAIVGSNLANKIDVKAPEAEGSQTIAFGTSAIAKSSNDVAIGPLNTAGVKGLYYCAIEGNKIQLSKSRSSATPNFNVNTEYGWEIGDTVSFVNQDKYVAYATITAVMLDEITVDKIPSTIHTYNFILDLANAYKPDDFTIFACYRKLEAEVKDPRTNETIKNERWYPRDGFVELGWAATAIGIENLVSGAAGFASGWNNWAAGDYGFVSGRDNIAGYTARAGGANAKALGQLAVAEGSNVEATEYASRAEGQNTKASGWAAHATNAYTEARGNASFACGRGTIAYAPDILACGSYNNWEKEWDWNKGWEDQKYTAKFIVGRGEKDARANCFVAGIDNTIDGKPSYIRVGGNKLISNQVGILATMADNEESENPYARVNDIPSLALYVKTEDLPISRGSWSTSLVLKDSNSGAIGEYSCALGYNVVSNPDVYGQFVCGTYNNPIYSTTNPSTGAQFIVGAGTSATDMKNCFAAGYKSGIGSYMYLGDQMLNAATLKTWLNSINNLRISAKDLVIYSGQSYTVVKERPPLENDWNAIDRDISNELRKSTVNIFYTDDFSSWTVKTWTFDINDTDMFSGGDYWYFNENTSNDVIINDVEFSCYVDGNDIDNAELVVEVFGNKMYSKPTGVSVYQCKIFGASLTIHNVVAATSIS